MTEAELVVLLNAFILVVYIGAVVAGAVKTAQRVMRYSQARFRRPRLLTRDMVFIGGHAVTFVLIGLARAFNWAPVVAGHWWWTLGSAAPAVIGILTYCWYEYVVIERSER